MPNDSKGKFPGIVYLIVNRVNGKAYVGKCESGNMRRRWQRHVWIAQNNPQIMRIASAINKYGRDSFDIAILAQASSNAELLALESSFIAQMGTRHRDIGYNATDGGDGSPGYERSEKHKTESAARARLRWSNAEWAEQTRLKMKGRIVTPAQREAISQRLKAKGLVGPKSAAFGRKMTDEQKLKMSIAGRQRWANPAYRLLQQESHRKTHA